MTVSGIGPSLGIGADFGLRVRQGASGFRVAEEVCAQGASAAGATDVASGSVLLALQEAGDDDARDRAARNRAREMMIELAALQRDVLRGRLSAANLKQLARLAEELPVAAAPALRAVLAGVVLRARVELARYEAHRPRLGS